MLHIIANTHAGHGHGRKVLAQAEQYLRKKNVPYQVHCSTYAGHAIELAHALRDDTQNVLVALGGDGTIAEVAQGMLGGVAKMGIIPAGSGNDYRRSHNIPKRCKAAVDVLLGGHSRRIDLMDLDGHIYVNILNVGFDLIVAERAQRYKRLGKLAYLVAVFDVLPHYQSRFMRLRMDEQVLEGKMFLCCAGCGSYYGGGMHALPNADPGDGLLDVCAIDEISVATTLRLLPKYMRGKLNNFACAHHYRTRTLYLESPDIPLALGGDGEVVQGSHTATLHVLPQALELLVP